MSHWNASSSGWEHAPAEPEQPAWGAEPGGWGGEPPAAQPGWAGQPLPYPAPPADPNQPPPPVSPYEQPPIWADSQPSMPAAPPLWEDQQPPVAYLRQQPEPPDSGRGSRALVAAAIVVLILLAAGTAIAFEIRSHHGTAARGAPTSQPGASHGPASPQPTSPASPTATASPSASPRPGGSLVAVAPGVTGNPAAPTVVSFLSRYFGDINAHNYRAFRRLLDSQMRQVETAQQFSTGFRSTTDSGATLTALSPAPDGRLAATVTFTSHQLPADSPDQSACTRWTITLYLERSGAGYLIGVPPAGYQALHQAC